VRVSVCMCVCVCVCVCVYVCAGQTGADFADAHQRQQSDVGVANPVDVAFT